MGEAHFGECLWLGVLQCISSVFATEKGDTQTGCLPFKLLEELLEPANVATVRERGYCEGEVVHVRDHQSPGDPEMQWSHVEKKKERGDW